MPKTRFLGITVLGDFILSEGVEAVLENLHKIGARNGVGSRFGIGNRTSFSYNNNGQQIAIENPLGNRSTTVFDAASQPVAQINPLAFRTTTTYDAAGQTIATRAGNSRSHSVVEIRSRLRFTV